MQDQRNNFTRQARSAAVDLRADETGDLAKSSRKNQLRWDKKKKKFVQGDGTGSDNKKLIRSESGALISASFKSGRFPIFLLTPT